MVWCFRRTDVGPLPVTEPQFQVPAAVVADRSLVVTPRTVFTRVSPSIKPTSIASCSSRSTPRDAVHHCSSSFATDDFDDYDDVVVINNSSSNLLVSLGL